MKDKHDFADSDPVTFGEHMRSRKELAVDERSVSTAGVFDRKLIALLRDFRVVATDRPGVDHDVAIGMATDLHFVSVQLEGARGIAVDGRSEVGHEMNEWKAGTARENSQFH